MDIDFTKIKGFIDQVESLKAPRWASRKMLVTVAVVAVMVWFFKATLITVLWPITGLVGLWLLCTTATDIAEKHYGTKFKIKLIENLAKAGGLTQAEVDILNKTLIP